ncbi:molybdate ABC transporter substrate-binding protein [Persephonella sp.]
MIKFLISFLLFIFAVNPVSAVTVAVSANVQYAVQELVKAFREKYPDIPVKTVTASSGKLTAQIERGAPYDIFMSADMKYPMYLYRKGVTAGKPQVYAEGVLVLWSMKNIPVKDKGLKVLESKELKKIAVPNPKNAPYGRASVEVLKNLGMYEKVKNRIVYGESVAQTSQYIYRQLVDAGFTAKSIVLSPKLKNKGVWVEVNRNLYSPIKQGAVLVKNSSGAEKFYRFLFSKKAKEILKKYGYVTE